MPFLLLITFVFLLSDDMRAQPSYPEFSWPEDKRAAVTLTFDDSRSSQIDVGLDLLNDLGAKAPCYVVPARMEERLEGWKRLAGSGYEIGNHALNHPCTGNFHWSREAALEDYTLERIRYELVEANRVINKEQAIKENIKLHNDIDLLK